MTVNILGTEYKVAIKPYSEDEAFERLDIIGYCDGYSKKIVFCDLSTHPEYGKDPVETREACEKVTLRHEIVHAFLNESGLMSSACEVVGAWSKNEEMVDWIALQGEKIYKAWLEVGAL